LKTAKATGRPVKTIALCAGADIEVLRGIRADGYLKILRRLILAETEMRAFMNNNSDFDAFEFYEETMGECMMLSGMNARPAGTAGTLSDETFLERLSIMQSEKENFDFNSDLHDNENMNLNAQRFLEKTFRTSAWR